MAATREKSKVASAAEPDALTKVAHRIAREVQRSEDEGRTTTLRRLLKRCGYQRRNAQTVRRVAAALKAAGVQCLPSPAGVESLDDTIRLQSSAFERNGHGAKKAAAKLAKNGAPSKPATQKETPAFASLEEMLLHARSATVLIKLDDGHGSGFVIDPAGLIVTARHVVGNNETVCARFEDGQEFEGRVLLSDFALDYAFVQGEPRDEFFTLHNDMHLSIGQPVYAVGTPLQTDLAGSVSRGIVSGMDRFIGGVNYIQTDASIHSGHSGGPLLTEDGDIIGMTLWGRPEDGIRFALPVHYLLAAWQLLQPQLDDLDARLYCADCGFLNGTESWLLCSSWVCCGHCGTVLGDLNAKEPDEEGECEDSPLHAVAMDRAQMNGKSAPGEASP